METLDPASRRRFPWKIRFDPLKPNQRWGLFAQEFVRLGGELAEAEDYEAEVRRLERLTPGDFAAVVRQYELWDETPAPGRSTTGWPSRWRPSGRRCLQRRPSPHRRGKASVYQ